MGREGKRVEWGKGSGERDDEQFFFSYIVINDPSTPDNTALTFMGSGPLAIGTNANSIT